jgi:hypothetical protein
MADRVDLLVAMIGLVVSILGSSAALWVAVSKKADRDDLARVETKLKDDLARVETKLERGLDRLEAKIDAGVNRVEMKLDALILRLVPHQLPGSEH